MIINTDLIYPIGSVYISVTDTNPSILFGGSWEQTAKSRMIMGAGSNEMNTVTTYGSLDAGQMSTNVGQRGGEVSHTLTVNEIPPHKHQIKTNNDDFNGTQSGGNYGAIKDGTTVWRNNDWYTENTGGGQAHNNIPPYEVFYIWKRVA